MDTKIYCLKCKIKTDTENITRTRTKHNRNLIRGICSICGNNKSVFVSMYMYMYIYIYLYIPYIY